MGPRGAWEVEAELPGVPVGEEDRVEDLTPQGGLPPLVFLAPVSS